MRPSTRIAVAAGVVLPLLLVGLHFLLPRLSTRFDERLSGLPSRTTDHFVVFAESQEETERTSRLVEEYVGGMVKRWGTTRGYVAPEPRVKVFIFRTHEELAKRSLLTLSTDLANNGGYFSESERSLALVGATEEGLRHELTHMLCSLSWGNPELSPWFSEGLAQWHEAGVEGGMTAGARVAVGALADSGELLPVKVLVAADQQVFTSEANHLYYYSSVGLVSWMATKKPAAFEAYLQEERASGRVKAGALERAVGIPQESIELLYREWAKNLND